MVPVLSIGVVLSAIGALAHPALWPGFCCRGLSPGRRMIEQFGVTPYILAGLPIKKLGGPGIVIPGAWKIASGGWGSEGAT